MSFYFILKIYLKLFFKNRNNWQGNRQSGGAAERDESGAERAGNTQGGLNRLQTARAGPGEAGQAGGCLQCQATLGLYGVGVETVFYYF